MARIRIDSCYWSNVDQVIRARRSDCLRLEPFWRGGGDFKLTDAAKDAFRAGDVMGSWVSYRCGGRALTGRWELGFGMGVWRLRDYLKPLVLGVDMNWDAPIMLAPVLNENGEELEGEVWAVEHPVERFFVNEAKKRTWDSNKGYTKAVMLRLCKEGWISEEDVEALFVPLEKLRDMRKAMKGDGLAYPVAVRSDMTVDETYVWVAEHLDVWVLPERAPSSMAWSLLCLCREDKAARKELLMKHLPRIEENKRRGGKDVEDNVDPYISLMGGSG